MSNQNHWVSKRDDGWAHKREGASRAAKVYPTQRQQYTLARGRIDDHRQPSLFDDLDQDQ